MVSNFEAPEDKLIAWATAQTLTMKLQGDPNRDKFCDIISKV